jgi:hypothetical protein
MIAAAAVMMRPLPEIPSSSAHRDDGGPALPPASQAAVWASLSLLLGSVADEIFGHAIPTDDTTAAALYRGRIEMALRLIGLPSPRPHADSAASAADRSKS